jgi:DNA adenine methylase
MMAGNVSQKGALVTGQIAHPIPYQGSKRRLAPQILAFFPEQVQTLFEPFAGSGALTLAAAAGQKAQQFALADSLPALAAIWSDIIHQPMTLASGYEQLWNEQRSDPKIHFERVRAKFNTQGGSARLLFLLTRCVKNAVRFNSAGEFNQSADHRRLGTRPARMRQHIEGAHELLAQRTTIKALDYAQLLEQATTNDLVYLDPPYQGTSAARDQRYHQILDRDRFVAELEKLRRRSIPLIVSFDGRTGSQTYGEALPEGLGLRRLELSAGRSTQSTLLGRNQETFESLYISPELIP